MKQITAKIMPNPHQVANLQKMFYILTNRGIRKVRKGKSNTKEWVKKEKPHLDVGFSYWFF